MPPIYPIVFAAVAMIVAALIFGGWVWLLGALGIAVLAVVLAVFLAMSGEG